MKQWLFPLLGSLFITLICVGCSQETTNQPILKSQNERAAFPEYLVGIWKADKHDWVFKFEPDGTISRVEHLLAGKVKMEEGVTQLEGREEGVYAVFVMGPSDVNYNADTRELSVKIILDYFRMEMPIGVLEGTSDDYFIGLVSEDGKTWKADWIGYTHLEGADWPDPNMIESNPVPLVFTKLDVK